MKKAISNVRYYRNENGSIAGVTVRPVVGEDGLYFRDLDNDGVLNPCKNRRKPARERIADLTGRLSVEEKLGMLFVSSWKMGLGQKDRTEVGESGLLNEEIMGQDESIFNAEKTCGTTYILKEMNVRHLILWENLGPEESVDWINQLDWVVEGCGHAIPVMVTSDFHNGNDEVVLGMNDAAGVFATWSGTLDIAAAVKGSGPDLMGDLAECIRQERDAAGMKKGYMHMTDVMTDPRRRRNYDAFGEGTEPVTDVVNRLIPGIQRSDDGAATDGVTVAIKYFPGGGARENGFDPHYVQGQWNVYQIKNSLRKYHLLAPQAAIDKRASSMIPYHAKPTLERSQPQHEPGGRGIPVGPVGFAFNRYFIQGLLREEARFEGYVNSDSGITNKVAWGVEELDMLSKIASAMNNGVDIISGSPGVLSARRAYDRGRDRYYATQGHTVLTGYMPGQLTLSDEALTRAVTRTLEEKFKLDLFDNSYRGPEYATEVVAGKSYWERACDVHRKSVVLLKNHQQTLSLTAERLDGRRVHAEYFRSHDESAVEEIEHAGETLRRKWGANVVKRHKEVDYAILFVTPLSGEYFHTTKGCPELDICENRQVLNVNGARYPAKTYREGTTLRGASRLREIYEPVRGRGGGVIANINFTLAWEMGNVEPYTDVLLAGSDTYVNATLDVIFEAYGSTGKVPIILSRGGLALAVDENGAYTSHNDMPGHDEDLYLPGETEDENEKAYTYRDADGNYYELDFGPRY